MSVTIGRFAKVTLYDVTIAEIGSYTLSGYTVDPIEITAFGDDAKDFIPGMGDPGTVELAGNYDPTDTTGQVLLAAACDAGTELGPGDLKFFVNTSDYLTVKTGGCIIITKSNAIGMDKAGVGTVSFTGKISGAPLEQKYI